MVVMMPISMIEEGKLPESVELPLDPGYGAYAVSVYHQLHCLNRIRRTFHANDFFPNETANEIDVHKSELFACFVTGNFL